VTKEDYNLFEHKIVLVIGGAGFVGSNLVRLLLNNVQEIKILMSGINCFPLSGSFEQGP